MSPNLSTEWIGHKASTYHKDLSLPYKPIKLDWQEDYDDCSTFKRSNAIKNIAIPSFMILVIILIVFHV